MYKRLFPVPLQAVIAAAACAFGFLLQATAVAVSTPIVVPGWGQSVALGVLAGLTLIAAVALRRRQRKKPVSATTGVRVLAASRAGIVVGALAAGFNLGLFLWVSGRLHGTAPELWLPMLAGCGAGCVLWVCAFIAERLCRIPPDNDAKKPEPETA